MFSATMAVLCCLSLAAVDPMSPSELLTGHPGEQQVITRPVAGTLQIEFECSNGPQSLGKALIATICGAECADCPAGQCPAQAGVAQSVGCQCVARCKTTTLGQLIQATCVCGEPVRVQQACPGGGTVIGISGATATLNCEQPGCHLRSIIGDGGEACPWVAEGACHVREVGAATNGQQNVWYVMPQMRVQAVSPQPSSVHINGFVMPATQPAPHDVLFTAPAPVPPAFAVSRFEWTQHPEAPRVDHDRITHLHEAARHLEAAGMPGEAQSLRQRAQEMEHYTRRLLEEKENQLRHLQQEIEVLRQALGHDPSQPQSPVSIHSEIIRVSPQGLQALREHGHGLGAGSVNRHEFQQLIEKLLSSGMAQMVARPQFITNGGEQAAVQCRLTSHEEAHGGNISCELAIRPVLHDGCCRLELQPQMRTRTAAGLRMESAQLSAELDPSQGLLAELTDDGSLLAFITWEHANPPQPTAAVLPPVSTQPVLVPASGQVQQPAVRFRPVQLPVPGITPASGQILVQPVFPQPFPARAPQCPADLQPRPPVPAEELVPPSPVR